MKVGEAMTTKLYEGLWRAKWTTDGAKTLEEAAEKLEQAAAGLRELSRDGVIFRQPVEDDYGYLETADPDVAKKHGLSESDSEDPNDLAHMNDDDE